jgi:AAA+ superfamily predicted ATPase
VDFRQIVNFKLAKQEASLLYKSLTPILKLDEKFADIILTDLAKVLQICGRSNREIGSGELLAYLTIYALIKQDKEKLNAALNLWEFSEEERLKYQKITLQILLDLTKDQQQPDQLSLPSILNRLDEEKGTNYLADATNAIYKFAQVVAKADGIITMQEMEALSLVWQLLHSYRSLDSYQSGLKQASSTVSPFQNSQSNSAQVSPPEQPQSEPKNQDELTQILDQALAELNDLVGLSNIKEEVRTLANFLKVQKVRAERGLATTPVSLHAVFGGPPGTGKTTVARLMSKIYQGLGFLKKGHLIETDRAGMVAGYIGQTAKKVDELVNSALDGVLFIDEAYALLPKEANRDFGQEAIDVLLKRMEDYRDRLVVIVAGYTDEMADFIEANPGLKSRFNRYFYFNDYTPDELLNIFEKMAEKSHFKLTAAARTKLQKLFDQLYVSRDKTFGNARLVRNLFEKSIEQQANRLAVLSALTDEVLTTLLPEDIPIEFASDRLGLARQQAAFGQERTQQTRVEDNTSLSSSISPSDIATQLNQSLPTGMTARVTQKDSNLQIMLEAEVVPDEQASVAFVREAIDQIVPRTITHITIYGRQSGDDIPGWSEEFERQRS